MFKNRLSVLALALLLPGALFADVLEFGNGDTLTGSVISQSDGNVVFKSDVLGEITVPADTVTVITADSPAEAGMDVQAMGGAPEPAEPTEEQLEASQSAADKFNESVNHVRSYVESIVPEGWSGKFNFGLSFIDTNTSTEAWNVGISATKDSGKNHYAMGAFYNFTSQTDASGTTSKTLDKWGGNFTYSRDLSERWFLQSKSEYLRDLVKNINHQATETVSLGYKVIDEEDFTFSILPGVAGQYIDAEGFDDHWLGYVTLGDELKYVFSEIFRLEQNAGGRLNPTNANEYQLYFNAAFIANLAEWIEASLNYNYTYDTTVGPGSNKGEQQIIFALGVPF